MATKFAPITLSNNNLQKRIERDILMQSGRIDLGNIKFQDVDNPENYTDGKIGETAIYTWFKNNKTNIVHRLFCNYSGLYGTVA